MSTARDLIKGSLRLLGALATGETPSADDVADALSSLNDLVDSWSNEGLLIHQKTREVFTLTSGQQSFTMGPTGAFVTSRAQKIESAGIILAGSATAEIPMDLITVNEWANIVNKSVSSSIPTKLYCENTYPNDTLNFWPVPSEATQVVLYSWKPLATFASANTVIALPPGYLRALKYNLAMELAPEYGKEPTGSVLNSAMESKENIKRMNIKPQYLTADLGVLSRSRAFNWITGE